MQRSQDAKQGNKRRCSAIETNGGRTDQGNHGSLMPGHGIQSVGRGPPEHGRVSPVTWQERKAPELDIPGPGHSPLRMGNYMVVPGQGHLLVEGVSQ